MALRKVIKILMALRKFTQPLSPLPHLPPKASENPWRCVKRKKKLSASTSLWNLPFPRSLSAPPLPAPPLLCRQPARPALTQVSIHKHAHLCSPSLLQSIQIECAPCSVLDYPSQHPHTWPLNCSCLLPFIVAVN